MERDLATMDAIQKEKNREISQSDLQPLDAEGQYLAEHKRYTLDIIDTPTDPLR